MKTRILLRQGAALYRLMRLDARPDGSLVIMIDRAPSVIESAQKGSAEGFQSTPEIDGTVAPHGKITCHTTGQINRYANGQFASMHYVQPLYELPGIVPVAMYSVPTISRLDNHPLSDIDDSCFVIEFPERIDERVTFHVGIGPKGSRPANFGIAADYEVYSLIIEPSPVPSFPSCGERFVEASPLIGTATNRHVDIANAELSFYNAVHGVGAKIFRENGGSYVALTQQPMRATPNATVAFTRDDLSAEIIPAESGREITHKIKFWINDRGGKNKKDDLREFIKSIVFDARMQAPSL